ESANGGGGGRGPAVAGRDRGDVTGSGHREPAAGLVIPPDPRPVGGPDVRARPRSAEAADVIDHGGGLGRALAALDPATEVLDLRAGLGGRGEQPGLNGGR